MSRSMLTISETCLRLLSTQSFGRTILLLKQNDRLDVPWDNSVNKNAVIYAAHTALDVRNMPLTG